MTDSADQLLIPGLAPARPASRRMILNTDGGARGNPGPAGIGWVLTDDRGQELRTGAAYIGSATNNQAEYRALLAGLSAALELSPSELEVRMDSELIVRQIQGLYRVKNAELAPLFQQVRQLLSQGPRIDFRHVPRAQNARADALYNQALDQAQGRAVSLPD